MMFNRTNCDRQSQFSGTLTEQLNPRVPATVNFSLSLPNSFVYHLLENQPSDP